MLVTDLFIFYNSCKQTAWNRYFFNEANYVSFTDLMRQELDARWHSEKLNLWNAEDRLEFEREVTKGNAMFPGIYAPVGEEPKFEELFTEW